MRISLLAAVLLIGASNHFELTTGVRRQMLSPAARVDRSPSPTLDSFRDRFRLLLVFSPTKVDQRYVRQAQWFAAQGGALRERDVLFVGLALEGEQGSHESVLQSSQRPELPAIEAVAARKRFAIADREFAVILIGKDGGEKFRTHTPVTIERLNALIDAMPMRQQEVRNGNSK